MVGGGEGEARASVEVGLDAGGLDGEAGGEEVAGVAHAEASRGGQAGLAFVQEHGGDAAGG